MATFDMAGVSHLVQNALVPFFIIRSSLVENVVKLKNDSSYPSILEKNRSVLPFYEVVSEEYPSAPVSLSAYPISTVAALVSTFFSPCTPALALF